MELDLCPIPLTLEQINEELDRDETYQTFLFSASNIKEVKAKAEVKQFKIINLFGSIYKLMILTYFSIVIYLNQEEAMRVFSEMEQVRIFA